MYILESFDKEMYERDLKENAIAEGLAEGRAETLRVLIKKKLAKGKSLEEIADALEEDVETVEAMIKKMEEFKGSLS